MATRQQILRFARGLTLMCAVLVPALLHAQGGAVHLAPRIAVHPLLDPADPAYGVYIADRIAYEFMQHSYFVPFQSARFELVESDTLGTALLTQIGAAKERLSGPVLAAVQQRVQAAYLLTGTVEQVGNPVLLLKLVDLQSGAVRWSESVTDNRSLIWTHGLDIGDVPIRAVLQGLGYGPFDASPPELQGDALPRKILLQPLYNVQYPDLANDLQNRLSDYVAQYGVFSMVRGRVSGIAPSRLGAEARKMARAAQGADAVLCGSLMVAGKEDKVYATTVLLRLMDVPSGRILWMGKASGRRVWRKDKLRDVVDVVVADLVENMAQFGADAARSEISVLLAQATDGPGWCDVGAAYYDRGLLQQAEAAFVRALTFSDARTRAHIGLGRIYARRPKAFDQAVEAFKQAIQEAPADLTPYVNLAQLFLDRRQTAGLTYAQKAIAIDSTDSRPYRILGDWYGSIGDDKQAVLYYTRYLRLAPEDLETAVQLGHALARLEDYEAIDRMIAPILNARPDAIALLPVVGFGAYRTGRFRDADRFFKRYLSQIDPEVRAHFDDVSLLLSAEDLAAYANMPEEARPDFNARFWAARDPDLTTEINERRLEHYCRVWVALRDFSERVYPWDRRGAVYIRYGKPDYRTRSGWIPRLLPTDVQRIKEQMYVALYGTVPDEELVGPVFPIKSARGTGMPRLSEEYGPSGVTGNIQFRTEQSSDAYGPVTLQNDNSIVGWESWVYVDIGGGLEIDFTQETTGISGFDFAPAPPFQLQGVVSDLRLSEYTPVVAFERTVSEQPEAYRAPSRPELPGLQCDWVDFRADSARSRFDLAYSMPLSAVAVHRTGSDSMAVLERGVALADSAYGRVYRTSARVQIPVGDAAGGQLVDLVRRDVPPGFYHMTATVMDLVSGRQKVIKQDVTVEAYVDDQLQISDLMLAQRVSDYAGAVRFRRGALEAVPNPARGYGADENLTVYYEIYNLTRDDVGQTRYRITVGVTPVEATPRERRPFGPKKQPEVTLTYEQVGYDPWERSYLSVDLSGVRPGPNLLTVSVTDLNGGGTAEKQTRFFYGEK